MPVLSMGAMGVLIVFLDDVNARTYTQIGNQPEESYETNRDY